MSVFVEQHLAMPGCAKYDDRYIFCCPTADHRCSQTNKCALILVPAAATTIIIFSTTKMCSPPLRIDSRTVSVCIYQPWIQRHGFNNFIFTTFTFQIYAFDRLHSTPGSSQPSHGTLVVIAATSNLPPGDTDVWRRAIACGSDLQHTCENKHNSLKESLQKKC